MRPGIAMGRGPIVSLRPQPASNVADVINVKVNPRLVNLALVTVRR